MRLLLVLLLGNSLFYRVYAFNDQVVMGPVQFVSKFSDNPQFLYGNNESFVIMRYVKSEMVLERYATSSLQLLQSAPIEIASNMNQKMMFDGLIEVGSKKYLIVHYFVSADKSSYSYFIPLKEDLNSEERILIARITWPYPIPPSYHNVREFVSYRSRYVQLIARHDDTALIVRHIKLPEDFDGTEWGYVSTLYNEHMEKQAEITTKSFDADFLNSYHVAGKDSGVYYSVWVAPPYPVKAGETTIARLQIQKTDLIQQQISNAVISLHDQTFKQIDFFQLKNGNFRVQGRTINEAGIPGDFLVINLDPELNELDYSSVAMLTETDIRETGKRSTLPDDFNNGWLRSANGESYQVSQMSDWRTSANPNSSSILYDFKHITVQKMDSLGQKLWSKQIPVHQLIYNYPQYGGCHFYSNSSGFVVFYNEPESHFAMSESELMNDDKTFGEQPTQLVAVTFDMNGEYEKAVITNPELDDLRVVSTNCTFFGDHVFIYLRADKSDQIGVISIN
jgi:hypothetical protein